MHDHIQHDFSDILQKLRHSQKQSPENISVSKNLKPLTVSLKYIDAYDIHRMQEPV